MLKPRPKLLYTDNKYCPGCGHGIINRMVAEVLEEMGEEQNVMCACAVGCACLLPESFGSDLVQSQHGRAAAVACGMKRARPDKIVFTYQGDGDALAIGLSETLYAAIRNEKITVIFVNNGVFGMTGGQMAPTTLAGQRTTTSLKGRDTSVTGDPLNVIEFMKTLNIAYLARGSVTTLANINKTKKMIRNAFEAQKNKEGYAFVEILSPCPTNWNVDPLKAIEHIEENVTKVYPMGEFITRGQNK